MKIYFEKTDAGNSIIITDSETAKVFDAAPSGIYEGIDLYSESAAHQLAEHFLKLDTSGELNDYENIYSPTEVFFESVKDEIDNFAELIYDTEK